tara:strand:- start:30660 stop:30872 length:213 start_codon:yes stop_codon:yes gene_type:complete
MKQYYSISECAKMIGVSNPTIYRWVAERRITYYKPTNGRLYFKLKDIESFIEAGKQDVVQTTSINLNFKK